MSDNKNPAPYNCDASGCLHDILATRLAAAEAERDATRKFARQTHDLYNQAICDLVDALAKGERLAAAEAERDAAVASRDALVDWLRSRGDCQSADDEIAAWLQLHKGTSNE